LHRICLLLAQSRHCRSAVDVRFRG